jgi:hypothetical protein
MQSRFPQTREEIRKQFPGLQPVLLLSRLPRHGLDIDQSPGYGRRGSGGFGFMSTCRHKQCRHFCFR